MPNIRKTADVSPKSPLLGKRVDKVVQELCGFSRAQVVGLFDHECVTINDYLCKYPGQHVEPGDRVKLTFDPHQRYHPKEKPRRYPGFDVVYEDKLLWVVLKPAKLLTVPTPKGESNTLLDLVRSYARMTGGQFAEAHHVHRLDRGVSGLLVFGRSEAIAKSIRNQFAANKPERRYDAIVKGVLTADEGSFDSLLATDRDLNRFSTDDDSIGQRAVTHYRVLRRMRDATWVRVWLETGRRNQIRVHFSEAGHPVLGDPRYRTDEARHRAWPYPRIALHARQLGFRHPATGRTLRCTSPLPAEMEAFLTTVED